MKVNFIYLKWSTDIFDQFNVSLRNISLIFIFIFIFILLTPNGCVLQNDNYLHAITSL